MVFCKYKIILNFMPATHLKKLGRDIFTPVLHHLSFSLITLFNHLEPEGTFCC